MKQTTTVAGFNPRTRKGCDNTRDAIAKHVDVSIHAPVKDATENGLVNVS